MTTPPQPPSSVADTAVPAPLAQVLDALATFVGVLTPDGVLLSANQAALQAAGLRSDEVVGKPFDQTYWWAYDARIQAELREAIGRARSGETVRYDVPVRIAEERLIVVDFRLTPLHDAEGRIERLAASAVDVTHSREATRGLARSEERLQQVLRCAAIGAWEIREDAELAWSDPYCAELFGVELRDGQAPLESFYDAIAAEYRETVAGAVERAWREGAFAVDFPLEREGRRFWIAGRGRVIGEVAGHRRMFGVNYDITEQVEAKRRLAESERRYRSLVLNASDAVYRRDLVHDAYEYLSPKIEDVTGFPPEAMEAMRLLDVFRRIHHDDRQAVQDAITRGMAEGEGTAEYRFLHANGYYRWLSDRFVIEHNETGEPVLRTGSIRDVTESKLAEQALRESEARLRVALEAGEMGAWVWHPPTGQASWTDEQYRMLGYEPGQVEPSLDSWLRRVHPEDVEPTRRAIARAVDTNSPLVIEHRVVSPDGEVRWLEARGRVVADSTGKAVRMYGVTADTSDRRQAEAALREATGELEHRVVERTRELRRRTLQLQRLAAQLTHTEQRERRRLAALLHDGLQQLLVAAKMQVGLARQDPVPEATRETLTTAMQLLDESIESSRDLTRQLRPPVLYEDGLGSALRWLADQTGERHGLNIRLRLDEDCDPEDEQIAALLFEAARELLFNTVKHANVKHARVSLSSKRGWVTLIVEDDGPGFEVESIDPDDTGFGLFSIRERLAAIGGAMHIRSRPGEGVTVTLIAPSRLQARAKRSDLARGDFAPAPTPGAPPSVDPEPDTPPSDASPGIRTLLVDDHPIVRQGIAAILKAAPGIDVVAESGDGVEGVATAQRHGPDLVLMDINLPGISGIEATRRIRRQVPRAKVIGLSVHEDPTMTRAMIEAGASAYVAKGGDPAQLLTVIRQVMASDDEATNAPFRMGDEQDAVEPGDSEPEMSEPENGGADDGEAGDGEPFKPAP